MSLLYNKYMELKSRAETKKLYRSVEHINSLEPQYAGFSDEELRLKTSELKESLQSGAQMEEVRPHAFALVREAAKRTIGLRHYDVQLIGGLVQSDGNIAQMQTGEGKTLVSTLPSFLFALYGKGVHVITSNEYLAKRDFELMGQIHQFLGLTVGLNVSGTDVPVKQEAYRCDITYGTGNEFGFDYLRDHMVSHLSQKVQRGKAFTIIDEIDSILIDEARTPLIIANKSGASTELFHITAMLTKSFEKGKDVEVDLPSRQVHLKEEGIAKIEAMFSVDNLYSAEHQILFHYLNQSLQAEFILRKDVDYIVKEGKVELVDAFTGRVMEGRNLSNGLHQAIEAKEGLEINEENLTQATVTVQNYFRMYEVLSGMTGSALPAQKEFMDIYQLDVIEIPTNKPNIRKDEPDLVYASLQDKYSRIVEEVRTVSATGRPILIGTTSIKQSEKVSEALTSAGISHSLLNAKTEEQEARMISIAGQKGQITISTNMAGRGTDILLGEGVAALGGLHIIGTERHESKRIDMQLRGRAGRQGDPGSSLFIVSLEDDLLNQYDDEELEKWTKKVQTDQTGLIVSPDPRKFMNKVQESVENSHFSSRVHLLKLEDHLDQQRKAVYGIRNDILKDTEFLPYIKEIFSQATADTLDAFFLELSMKEQEEYAVLHDQLQAIMEISSSAEEFNEKDRRELDALLSSDFQAYMEQLSSLSDNEEVLASARGFALSLLDEAWIRHLDVMDELKDGIGLRGYGQEDPYRLFQMEAFQAFEDMLKGYRFEVLVNLRALAANVQESKDVES
ncbi:accessory Sec system translocase SecA2 [Metabacillus sp. GX 13764]|uniref:accessory Sec system translocase SecA2 n=1 Tax=Metabacillus kandeliae TaxID=2900151 RepID=UPI001E3754D1|nr:accessory Sec system translocase SecA2 [Metabacillus kandeliae]MCD7034474.1 accessory Sec system translocase SecA2 [Metabacillus kandeliae]